MSERAAVNAASGGAGNNQAGPLADACRYTLCVPSRHNTPTVGKYPVSGRAEAEAVLASLPDGKTRRYWIVDTHTEGRPKLEDLP